MFLSGPRSELSGHFLKSLPEDSCFFQLFEIKLSKKVFICAWPIQSTMPPKKIEAVKDNVVAFGRVRKNLKMGCVGLPNVGKSSLFNLLTEQSAAAENYPFCTIEPNEARCPVPDARYVSRDTLQKGPQWMAKVDNTYRTFSVTCGSRRPCTQHICRSPTLPA